MISEIGLFSTQVVIKNQRDRIYLSSQDRNLIDHALTVLQEYTSRIDPGATIRIRKVKQIESSFRVNIRELLPRAVARFYDGCFVIKDAYTRYPALYHNCHGTSLVCAGVTHMAANMYHPIQTSELEEVPLQEIRAGDIVLLNDKDHSFVFLSHELCLSKNGRSNENQFKLASTRDILKTYDAPEDCLRIDRKCVQIFRKDSENLFKPILDELLEFPLLYEKALKRVFPWKTEEAVRMEEIFTKLESHVAELLTLPEMDSKKKETVMLNLSIFKNRLEACREVKI